MPEITIITPTYKRPVPIIRRCIDSVLHQTFSDWEQIICSDGGTEDHVVSLLKEVNDPRIRYMFSDEKCNDHAWSIRCDMLDEARGKYVAFVDDDNYIAPTYLCKLHKPFKETGCHFTICSIIHMGPLPKSWGNPPRVLTGVPPKLYSIDTLQVMANKETLKSLDWSNNTGYFFETIYEQMGNKFLYKQVPEILGVHF